jgi:hypothetical protein
MSGGDYNDDVVELATECNDSLAQDIVIYNETYSVENFFGCLTKKREMIIAEADNNKVSEQ